MNDLIAETKRHILEEYSLSDWLFTDKETHAFFRSQAAPPKPKPEPKAAIIAKPAPVILKRTPEPKKEVPKVEKTPPMRQPTKRDQIRRDFQELRSILKETRVKIIEEIPSDEQAKRIADGWKDPYPEVALVAIHATKNHLELLEKIAKAIEGLGFEAKVLIGEQQWEKLFAAPKLKLMLVEEETLKGHAAFRNTKVKVCPLKPINTYLEKPEEKAQLWKQIRELL